MSNHDEKWRRIVENEYYRRGLHLNVFSRMFIGCLSVLLAPFFLIFVLRVFVCFFGLACNPFQLVDTPQALKTPLEFTKHGMTQVSLGQSSTAISSFNQALAINKEYAPAIQGVGLARWQEGDQAEALRQFDRAASLYEQQGNPIAVTYMRSEVKQLQQGSLPCMHWMDNSDYILKCAGLGGVK